MRSLSVIFITLLFLSERALIVADAEIRQIELRIQSVKIKQQVLEMKYCLENSSGETLYLHRNTANQTSVVNRLGPAKIQNKGTGSWTIAFAETRTDGDQRRAASAQDFIALDDGFSVCGRQNLRLSEPLSPGYFKVFVNFSSDWWAEETVASNWGFIPWRGTVQSSPYNLEIPVSE